MQRCRFCSRYLNPKAFACTYCGKKTGREAVGVLKTAPVALPPLEYAGGVVGATPGFAPHQSAVPSAQSGGPADVDLAAFDAALARAAQQLGRRRWFRDRSI